jgi:hypothetical protein
MSSLHVSVNQVMVRGSGSYLAIICLPVLLPCANTMIRAKDSETGLQNIAKCRCAIAVA